MPRQMQSQGPHETAAMPFYGDDGHACRWIVDAIAWKFGLRAENPEQFQA